MERYLNPIISQYGRLLEGDPSSLNLEVLVRDFQTLRSLISADALGWGLLSQGGLSGQIQKRVVGKLLDKIKAHVSTRDLVFLLIQKGRLKFLPGLMDFFQKKEESQGCDVAQLVTAKTFSSQELEEIKDMLVSKDAIGTKLETTVDSELLGGAILFWRGLMIDGSVKTFLNHLKK